MGLLSKIIATGAKGADVSKAARSIPKREMNPLLKRRGEELRKKIEDENVGVNTEDITIGKMYSPLISTAEQMDIGVAGTKGENIEAFLRKRAPNVTEAEKQFYELGFEPTKKYTREEVLDTLNNVNKEYTIRKRFSVGDSTATVGSNSGDFLDSAQQFETAQRQPIAARKEKYEELMVDADKGSIPLGEEKSHFNPDTVVHTRLSVIRPYDDPDYKAILVEEIQTDLHHIANMTDEEIQYVLKERRYTPFSGFYDEINPFIAENDPNRIRIPAHEWHEYNVDSMAYEYDLKVSNTKAFHAVVEAYNRLEKLESATGMQAALENGKRQIKEELRLKLKDNGIEVDARDPYNLIQKAYRYILELDEDAADYVDFDSWGGADDGMANYFESQLDGFIPEIMEEYNEIIMTNIRRNKGQIEYKSDPRKPAPIQSKTEVMRKGILANIAYAKENGINKILIPSAEEIARQRVGTFRHIAHEIKDQKLVEKYYELDEKGFSDKADELALEYFTKVFTPLYENAAKKVLRSLANETKGAIKVGTKQMPYRNVLENTEEMKTLIEVDITNFEFDPKNDALRFNRGGLVA